MTEEKEVYTTTIDGAVHAGEWAERLLIGDKRKDNQVTVGYVDNSFQDKIPATVPYSGLMRHTLVTGVSGYGKSTLFETLLVQIAENGDGFCYIDPKGDSSLSLLQRLPNHRLDDIVVLGTQNGNLTRTIDVFDRGEDTEEARLAAAETILQLLKSESYWGPMMEYAGQNLFVAAMEGDYTLTDINTSFLQNDVYELDSQNAEVVQHILESKGIEAFEPLLRRVSSLCETSIIADSQSETPTLSLHDAINNGKIILVRPEMSSELQTIFTSTVVLKLWEVFRHRLQQKDQTFNPYFLFVDEANAVLRSDVPFGDILSKARSAQLGIGASVQRIDQLSSHNRNALIGNCGNIITFNPGDLQTANELTPLVSASGRDKLLNLPRFQTYVSLKANYGVANEKVMTFPNIAPRRSKYQVESFLTNSD